MLHNPLGANSVPLILCGQPMPPTRAIRPFDLALQHHQAGRLREARQFYEAALATQPNHADALHCLGVLSMSWAKWRPRPI